MNTTENTTINQFLKVFFYPIICIFQSRAILLAMIIKKIFFIFLFFLTITKINTLSAQISSLDSPLQIAYINSIDLLEMVPGKTAATKAIEQLNKKYKDELVVMQNDYNAKYTDFLANQNNMAESIKLRRMQELYELEQSINRFMKVAQEDVDSQEQQLIVPLKEKLQQAVNEVGIEQGYVCIYDKADPTLAFITPNAVDATPLVKTKLTKRK